MIKHIEFSKNFTKDFEKLDLSMQHRVLLAIEKIHQNPYQKAKKLRNEGVGMFRVRIGDYRIRFDILDDKIWFYRVKHRRDVYKK